MPWFAWLFLLIVVPATAWWLLDECHYQKSRLQTEETALARARAVVKSCPSGHTDCTADCGRCKGTGVCPPSFHTVEKRR